jgi:hypothetical protein
MENKRASQLIFNGQDENATPIIIRQIYCGQHGQFKSALQLLFHYLYFRRLGRRELAEKILSIVVCEMEHLDRLANYLEVKCITAGGLTLEGKLWNFLERCDSDNSIKMLLDDLVLNCIMIREYENMENKIKERQGRELIKNIIFDEKKHHKILNELLKKERVNLSFSTCKGAR